MALALAGVVIAALGENPWSLGRELLSECLGSGYGLGQVLQQTTQLTFTGLAVGLGFRAGLFNIGAEGQAQIGAFCVAMAGIHLGGLPPMLLVPICILAALAGGALWAAVPGGLKAATGAHEVITTIMMNFIAAALLNYLLTRPGIQAPGTERTAAIADAAHLPTLEALWSGFAGSTGNTSLLLALAAAVVTGFFLSRTRWGYEITIAGSNPEAARTYGISLGRTTLLAMMLSGALAALVGVDFVMGYKHWFELEFTAGVGYMGIAVALLGRNHPAGIVGAAFLFGLLAYGGVVLTSTAVPKELVEILQAIVILLILINSWAMRRWMLATHKRRLGRTRPGQ
ncbi:MAG: ABC transporter permease [Candidatus Sumerlaeia bacterium]